MQHLKEYNALWRFTLVLRLGATPHHRRTAAVQEQRNAMMQRSRIRSQLRDLLNKSKVRGDIVQTGHKHATRFFSHIGMSTSHKWTQNSRDSEILRTKRE